MDKCGKIVDKNIGGGYNEYCLNMETQENYGNIQIGRKISEFQYLKFNVPDGEKIGGEGNVQKEVIKGMPRCGIGYSDGCYKPVTGNVQRGSSCTR